MVCASAFAIHLPRARAKGVHQAVADLIEHRAERQPDQSVMKLEIEIKAHLAGLLAQRVEAPETLQMTERSIHQPYLDHLVFLQPIAGGEGLVHPAVGDFDLTVHLILVAAQLARGAAPGQEFVIRADVIHQGVHIACRVGH